MSFWESLKAGFYGAAGVDYYAKKTREEVAGLRADLRTPDRDPWSDAAAVQAAFRRLEQAVLAAKAAFTDDNAEPRSWLARIDLAMADLSDVLDDLERDFPVPHGLDQRGATLARHYHETATAFRRSAELWTAGDIERSGKLFLEGNLAWNAMMDEVDRLAG